MMFGGGAIPDAIDLCNRQVYARGLRGDLAMGVTLAALLLGSALGRRSNGVLRPHDIGVALDGGSENRIDRLLVLATTLHRLILGPGRFGTTTQNRFATPASPIRPSICCAPLPECCMAGGAARCLRGL